LGSSGAAAPAIDTSAPAGPVAAALAASLVSSPVAAAAQPGVAPAPGNAGGVTAVNTVSATAAAAASTLLAAATPGDKHSRDSGDDAATPDGSLGAAQLSSSAAAAAAAPVTLPKLEAAVGSSEFSQGITDRVSYLMDNNLSSATLQVSPPQLGPIDIRIDVQNGHAQVWLSANSAVTRDALTSSATQLREMLGNQGFGQVSVDVSQRSFQDTSGQTQSFGYAQTYDENSASLAAASSTASLSATRATGMLDAYA
jgi:flagellar hook-length control protein FliK